MVWPWRSKTTPDVEQVSLRDCFELTLKPHNNNVSFNGEGIIVNITILIGGGSSSRNNTNNNYNNNNI